MQCLTAEHAKQMLREGASVLDSALDAGLSGPGRLHDLCVTLGAAHAVLQEIPTAQPTALRPLRACVKGSKFQIRVWRALLRIPPAPQSATVASPRSEIDWPPARWEQR